MQQVVVHPSLIGRLVGAPDRASYGEWRWFHHLKCFQISFPDTGNDHVRPRTPHLCMRKRTTHVNRTYSQTYRFIYIDSRSDMLYFYTQLVLMNCTFVYTTHINGTHTRTFHFINIDSSTDILYYYLHLVQMECTCVYTTVHCCTT